MRHIRDFCGPFARPMAIVLGLLFLEQIVTLVIPGLQGLVIDALIRKSPLREIHLLALGLCAVLAVDYIIGMVRWEYHARHLNNPMARHISRLTIERLTSLSIGQHVSENSGVKQSVISSGQNAIPQLVHLLLENVLPLVVELGVVTLLLLIFCPFLGLILLVGGVAFGGWTYLLNARLRPKLQKQEELQIQEARFRNEILKNMELVLQAAQEPRAVAETDKLKADIQERRLAVWIPYVRVATGRDMIMVATRYGVLATGAAMVIQGSVSVGMMVTYWTWAVTAMNRVQGIGPVIRSFMEYLAALDKFFQLLDTEPEITIPQNPIRPTRFKGDITFESVTLRYRRRKAEEDRDDGEDTESQDDPSLFDVSLHIPAGRRVAFVGESGAGKSTIVYALMHSQKLAAGRILVDGHDLQDLDYRHLRRRIGVVPQHTFLFDMSLRYNLTFALDPSETVSDEELERIAAMARVDRFLDRMEHRWDTLIGERGVKLSGGERQRVGIARALLKRPDILVFDEATSSLDPMNEAEVQQAIDEASAGRTTIIVAHRYSTIRNVDGIFVMDRGRIAGYGTHDELMKNCEPYQRLLQQQLN